MLQACSGLGREDTTATVEVPGAAHLEVLTTKPVLRALAAVLAVDGIPRRAAVGAGAGPLARETLRGVASGMWWDSEAAGLGGEEGGWLDAAEGAMERMWAAGQAVLDEGCTERRRLEAATAGGGGVEAWEAAALAWHRVWHECGEAGGAEV